MKQARQGGQQAGLVREAKRTGVPSGRHDIDARRAPLERIKRLREAVGDPTPWWHYRPAGV